MEEGTDGDAHQCLDLPHVRQSTIIHTGCPNANILRLTIVYSNVSATMLSPGIPSMMAELGVASRPVATFAVSIYILGLGLGPMFVSSF